MMALLKKRIHIRKAFFLLTLLTVLMTCFMPAVQAAQVRGEISFKKIANARDLGGYSTEDGRRVRKRLLIRSGELSYASRSDRKKLKNKYHLKMVIDLRHKADYKYCPDQKIPGVRYKSIPAKYVRNPKASTSRKRFRFFRKLGSGKLKKKAAARMKSVSKSYTRSIVLDEYSQRAYRAFFKCLLSNTERKGILFHCIHGKDRTGVAAFMTLVALGVNEETAYRDYAMTNAWKRKTLAKKESEMKAGVRVSDLRAAVEEAKEIYGSMSQFLEEAYGLDAAALRKLRRIYTE